MLGTCLSTVNAEPVLIMISALILSSAAGVFTYLSSDPIVGTVQLTNTVAFIFWSTSSTPQNSILDEGEHATLVISYNNGDKPQALDKIRAEISLPTGAALTMERNIPNISYSIVDLG